MKQVRITLLLAMVILMASASFAALTSGGGTEDFESVGSLSNGDSITESLMSNISGWEYYFTPSATPHYYYDNDDTSGFSTAAGASTKPAGPGCLRVYSTGGIAADSVTGCTKMTLGRTITMSAWVAVKTFPSGRVFQFALHFPDWNVDPNTARVMVVVRTNMTDINFRVQSEITNSDANEDFEVGAKNDGLDYALNTWNKVEITVTSSASGTGQAQMSFNGSVIGTSVLKSDPAGNFLSPRFNAYIRDIATGEVYIDDITVEAGTEVNDWMMFE